MIHMRQQIREQIATMITGLSVTGDNVFKNRLYSLERTDLPCLVVETLSDQSEGRASFDVPVVINKTLTIKISAYVKANDSIDDALDTICADVEAAMAADRCLNSLAIDSAQQSTAMEFITDGDKPHGLAEIEYIVQYRVREDAPDTAA